MKTSEFKNLVRNAGYTWHLSPRQNLVIEPEIIKSGNSSTGSVSEFKIGKYTVSDLPILLAKALIDYANTSIKERKDEKRFRVHVLKDNAYGYISQYSSDKALLVGSGENISKYKTSFTESEWNKVRGYLPAYDKDNPMFERGDRR